MSFLDLIKENIGLFGGYSAIVIGLSTWLGSIAAKRIIQNHTHSQDKEIEILRQNLEIMSHDKKNRATRYDNKRASALENLHIGLIEFQVFVNDTLKIITHDWKNSYNTSKDLLNSDTTIRKIPVYNTADPDYLKNPDNYVPFEKYKTLEASLEFNKIIIDHVKNNSFTKWEPEFKKIETIILKNEIYLNQNIVQKSFELVSSINEILKSATIEILEVASSLDATNKIDENTGKKIQVLTSKTTESCKKIFNEVRHEITKEIKSILEPVDLTSTK